MKLGRNEVAAALAVLLAGALSFLWFAVPPRALAGPNDARTEPDAPMEPDADPLFPIKQDGKWGYIDRAATIVIPPQFDEAGDFFDGLAAVRIGRKWGYIDKAAELAIEPQFSSALPFCDGLAGVEVGDKWGQIDANGNFVCEPRFRFLPILWFPFCRELIAVQSDDAWYYTTVRGCVIVPQELDDSAYPFSEGLVVARTGRSYGYIDKTGKWVIEPHFSGARWFSGGLAPVRIGGVVNEHGDVEGAKWGYIDMTGDVVIEASFDDAESFWNGLARVTIGHKIGYIDKSGKYVWEPTN